MSDFSRLTWAIVLATALAGATASLGSSPAAAGEEAADFRVASREEGAVQVTPAAEPVGGETAGGATAEPAAPGTAQSTTTSPEAPPAASLETSPAPRPAVASTEVPTPSVAPPEAAPAISEPQPAAAAPLPAIDGVTAAIGAEMAKLSPKADAAEAALRGFYAARASVPAWVGPLGLTPRGEQVASTLAAAGDWGLEAKDYQIPALDPAPGEARPADARLAAVDIALTRAALRYARDARGGRIDPRELSLDIDRSTPLLAPDAVLDDLAKTEAPGAYLTSLQPQHAAFQKLRKIYLELKTGDAAARAKAQRVLLNMEQWRWMPVSLGDLYVWANIPEFTVRVVKDGRIIHSERMIAGKTDKQTPVFSDMMETIVFNPIWGVPDSIKVKEVLPSLLKGGKILGSHNLRIAQGGRDIDPRQVDWTKSDIRNYHVYQPPGGGNVLGVVKFLFPNKHQVYMHDTPTKNLFNSKQRTFSHGCMRVRDPLALANILLEADKGWPQSRIAALAKPGAAQNNSVALSRKIPVHVTYFTASVDDDGKLDLTSDPYGHEKRIQMGLDGKAHLIPKKKVDLASARADVIARLGEAKASSSSGWTGIGGNGGTPDWARRAFSSY